MAVRIWLASLPPPVASNASVAPVATRASTRSAWNVGALELQTYFAPRRCRISACSGLAHDVHERDAVRDAQLVQHLAEIRCGGGVHERLVALGLHGLDHAERGERVHETGGAFARASFPPAAAGTERDGHAAVLGVHAAAHAGDGAAQQRLGGRRRARLHDDSGAFVAHGHGLVEARSHGGHESLGDVGCDDGPIGLLPVAVAVLMSAKPNSSPMSEGLIGAASTRIST